MVARSGDAAGRRRWGVAGIAMAAAVLLTLAAISSFQATHWRDTQSFWRRSLACSPRNATGHLNLAFELRKDGRLDESIFHLEIAHEIEPDAADILLALGIALADTGRPAEAVRCLARAAELDPRNTEVEQASRRLRQSR